MFHILLLEHDTTKKEWVDENVTKLDVGNSEKYKVEAIWDSVVYAEESESGQLLSLNCLVVTKGYLNGKNT